MLGKKVFLNVNSLFIFEHEGLIIEHINNIIPLKKKKKNYNKKKKKKKKKRNENE